MTTENNMKKVKTIRKIIMYVFLALGVGIIVYGWFATKDARNDAVSVTTGSQLSGDIMDYYVPEYQHLLLSNQGLTKVPDLCKLLPKDMYDQIASVTLSANSISRFDQDWTCLTRLGELNIAHNDLQSLGELTKIDTLTVLLIHKNQLTDLDGIENLWGLQTLQAGWNQITDISGIGELSQLQVLFLNTNQLTDISPVRDMNALIELRLEFNQLDNQDLEVIPGLTSLQLLTLAGNDGIDESIIESFTAQSRAYLDEKEGK